MAVTPLMKAWAPGAQAALKGRVACLYLEGGQFQQQQQQQQLHLNPLGGIFHTLPSLLLGGEATCRQKENKRIPL